MLIEIYPHNSFQCAHFGVGPCAHIVVASEHEGYIRTECLRCDNNKNKACTSKVVRITGVEGHMLSFVRFLDGERCGIGIQELSKHLTKQEEDFLNL